MHYFQILVLPAHHKNGWWHIVDDWQRCRQDTTIWKVNGIVSRDDTLKKNGREAWQDTTIWKVKGIVSRDNTL